MKRPISKDGWLLSNGKFFPLRRGEHHQTALTRLFIQGKISLKSSLSWKDAIRDGHVRVCGIDGHMREYGDSIAFQADSNTLSARMLISKLLPVIPANRNKIAVEFDEDCEFLEFNYAEALQYFGIAS